MQCGCDYLLSTITLFFSGFPQPFFVEFFASVIFCTCLYGWKILWVLVFRSGVGGLGFFRLIKGSSCCASLLLPWLAKPRLVASVIAALLVITGVERNPGPDKAMDALVHRMDDFLRSCTTLVLPWRL